MEKVSGIISSFFMWIMSAYGLLLGATIISLFLALFSTGLSTILFVLPTWALVVTLASIALIVISAKRIGKYIYLQMIGIYLVTMGLGLGLVLVMINFLGSADNGIFRDVVKELSSIITPDFVTKLFGWGLFVASLVAATASMFDERKVEENQHENRAH